MSDKDVVKGVRDKFEALAPVMGERVRRQWAAAEAMGLGRGGIAAVSTATGLSRTTVGVGIRELRGRAAGIAETVPVGRARRAGGGRKRLAATDATLLRDLEALVEPTARGDP